MNEELQNAQKVLAEQAGIVQELHQRLSEATSVQEGLKTAMLKLQQDVNHQAVALTGIVSSSSIVRGQMHVAKEQLEELERIVAARGGQKPPHVAVDAAAMASPVTPPQFSSLEVSSGVSFESHTAGDSPGGPYEIEYLPHHPWIIIRRLDGGAAGSPADETHAVQITPGPRPIAAGS